MHLSNHFGAYADFSNVLGQRFHSLDKLHDKKTLFVLSLLPCNLFDSVYHKTSSDQPLKKKDDLIFFSYDLKQVTFAYKTRDPTVQRNYSDGQSLPPQNNREQHVPTG